MGEVGNPKCGDIMRMYLKIENNVNVDVKFLTFGCGAAIATSSMATDLIKGKTIDEALKADQQGCCQALEGLPPIKVHCSVLAEQAVKAALSDYYRRQGITRNPSWARSKKTATTARAAATDPLQNNNGEALCPDVLPGGGPLFLTDSVQFANCSKSPQRFATIVRYTVVTVREGTQRRPPKSFCSPSGTEHAEEVGILLRVRLQTQRTAGLNKNVPRSMPWQPPDGEQTTNTSSPRAATVQGFP